MLRVATPNGTSRIDADDFPTGPPELVVEVAASSVSYDLHQEAAGLPSGRCARVAGAADRGPRGRLVRVRRGAYERVAPDGGVLRSETFPGLWLDLEGLLAGDDPAMRAVLLAGVETSEHAAFCTALA